MTLLSTIDLGCQQELHGVELTFHLWNGVVLLIICFGSLAHYPFDMGCSVAGGFSVSNVMWLNVFLLK